MYDTWCLSVTPNILNIPDIPEIPDIPNIPTIPEIPIIIQISSSLWFRKTVSISVILTGGFGNFNPHLGGFSPLGGGLKPKKLNPPVTIRYHIRILPKPPNGG